MRSVPLLVRAICKSKARAPKIAASHLGARKKDRLDRVPGLIPYRRFLTSAMRATVNAV
jgi:hypothetical protein